MLDPNSIPWYVWLISGVLFGVGFITALPNTMSEPITDQDNLGWWLMIAGAAVVVLWFAIPFWPVLLAALTLLWERGSTSMILAALAGIVLILCGIAWKMKH